jgi:signal transduction histidine kinase
MLLVTLAALALLTQLLLTLVVLLRDMRALGNKAFTLLSSSLAFWAALTFAFDVFPDFFQNIYTVRATMFFVVLQNCFFPLFTRSLLGKPLVRTKRLVAYIVLSIVTAALMLLTPSMFSELAANKAGGYYPVAQPGMLLFVIHAAISITFGFKYLLRRLRQTSGTRHQQLIFILIASVVLWGVVPVTNFALSISLQSTFYAKYTPLFTLAFSSLIVYAIVKHRLFNVRLAIARTISYVLLLLTLASVYALIIFGLARVFFGTSNVTFIQNAVYVTLAMFLAFTFDPLRRFFSRLTNKFFFQDIYNTDLILDKLSNVLVHSTSVSDLAHRSLKTLNAALRADAAAIVAMDKKTGKVTKVVGIGSRRLHIEDLVADIAVTKQRLLVLDEINESGGQLARDMQSADIAVIDRMETSRERIGYIVFGYKSDGGVYTDQDLDLIQIAADELAVAIQNALRFEEISHFNETLQGQVREATGELRESNKKLKSLDEAKDEFISMASHQLRTPLTSVKGYLSMVLEGDAGKLNPTQHQLLEQAFASAQRMVYLISDFLNVSRLQTGKFTIERTPVILSNVVQQEVNQLKSTAESRNLTLECNVPSNFPVLQLDESKLRQAIMNFIDNAIFYSRPGGVIKVDLIKTGADLALTVQDSGIGVPMSERHHLFTKFYRATNARTARPDGTGIGLFMAKKVVVAHGGSIIFNSVEGKGSTFGFRLPLKQPAELPAEDHPKELKK